ncbi:MAG: SAM-dependent methyltransferase [Alphaproteobacteria bacterium]|nr:SAM-dependent methyltransferase [Alphaproteobacteria bacterium]MDE2110035.1 SAM-dependent methyltransferase [Alphaproteobacteria bacterium]MDE2492967.1 SAM-dependent methyltransferase [Alphaproteobacteria bacterium]
MNALAARIAELIAADGPLSIAQFMTLCLHDPAGGTYGARDPIGRDFVTAPEISQAFGELLGLWTVQAWHDQGRAEGVRLVELGPGRGTLIADALRAITAAAPDFLGGAEVVLVEASPILEALQRDKLKTFTADISWCKHFDDNLTDRPLFLLANEFFDCLPVRQFVKTVQGWHERMITVENGALAFALTPAPAPSSVIPSDRAEAPTGGVYEIAPAALTLAEEIAAVIAAKGGAALIVDYGYDSPGFGETLQAVAGHKFAEVLAEPGESDLSAHVDFYALAKAVEAGGAAAYGPVTQCNLLADLGIGPRAERLMITNPTQARIIADAVDRLVNPEKMGALFKALAVAPKNTPPPPGFC